MVALGIAYIALPIDVLGIPKEDLDGSLRLWGSSLKLFAVPLCLLILNFTKNFIIQLLVLLWGLWILIISVLFFVSSKDLAPGLTQYGRAFVAVVIIFALCQLVFSATKFLPKNREIPKTEDPPVNPS